MSRYIETDENGRERMIIASMQQCKELINDVCCNENHSDMLANFPDADYCRRCEFFTKEDGKL